MENNTSNIEHPLLGRIHPPVIQLFYSYDNAVETFSIVFFLQFSFPFYSFVHFMFSNNVTMSTRESDWLKFKCFFRHTELCYILFKLELFASSLNQFFFSLSVMMTILNIRYGEYCFITRLCWQKYDRIGRLNWLAAG